MEYRSLIEKLLVLGVLLTNAANGYGQTNTVANGNWSDPLTWSAGEPTDAVPANINGGFNVTIDQVGETTNLLKVGGVAAQNGQLTISGGNLFINDPNTTTEPNTPGFLVGVSGGTGTVTMSAGDVFVGGTFGSDIFTPAGGAGPVNPNGEAIIGLECG